MTVHTIPERFKRCSCGGRLVEQLGADGLTFWRCEECAAAHTYLPLARSRMLARQNRARTGRGPA